MKPSSFSASLLAFAGLFLFAATANAVQDTNSNGLSDVWERYYNADTLFSAGNPNHAATADPDGDGWTNADEAIAGTNPFSTALPEGCVRTGIVQHPEAEGLFILTWPSIQGKVYKLFLSSDLVAWTSFGELIPGTDETISLAVDALYEDGTSPERLFWRVKIEDDDPDGDTLTTWEELALGYNPYSLDTDLDGIPDNLDSAPLVSATFADPDGTNPPVGSTASLRAFWDFESQQTPSFPAVFPDRSGSNRHATSSLFGPSLPGMPSKSAITGGSGYVVAPASSLQGQNNWTISGWFRVGSGNISGSAVDGQGNGNYRIIYALYDQQGTSPQGAPLGIGNVLAVRKSLAGETWMVGGYQQTTYFNEPPFSNGNPKTIFADTTFNRAAGKSDDDKWHHFAVTRATGSFGQKVYIDGSLVHSAALSEFNSMAYDGDTRLTFGRLYPTHFISAFQESHIDRVRVHGRALSLSDISNLYHQDIDNDGLWDITEARTELWRDGNSDAIRTPSEYTYLISPFVWQPADHDLDGDGITNIDEQNVTLTDIANPDSDGDLMPDGWERLYGLDPTNPADAAGHGDTDGLSNLDEYRHGSNPTLIDADGDGTNDNVEVTQGSNPNDDRDAGQPPNSSDNFSVLLGVGDNSGSHSEDYVLNCFRIDQVTGNEIRVFTLRSDGFGQYDQVTKGFFRRGETYSFQIDWQGSNLQYRSASQGVTSEGPDYDYTFKVQHQGNHGSVLVDSWDPEAGSVHTDDPILDDDANDVTDFPERVEKRRVLLFSADVDVDSNNDNQVSLPDRSGSEEKLEDPDEPDTENLGKVVWVNHDDTDSDGIPGYADGIVGVTPGVTEPVMDNSVVPHSRPFVPVVVAIPDPSKWPSMRLKISYPGSDPSGISVSFDADGQGSATLPTGNLRLWTRDGGAPGSVRRPLHIADSGHWVAPDQEFSANQLGERQADGSVVLYLEAIRPSSDIAGETLTLSVDLDGSGGLMSWQEADTVRFTALDLALLEAGQGGSLTRVFHPGVSNPSPDIDASVSVANVRSSVDGETILGDIVISGTVAGGGADFMPSGTVPEITLRANTDERNGDEYADPVYTISVNGSKGSGGYDKPYPFTGNFSQTLTGVELQAGFNTLRLSALDPLTEMDGTAEFAIQIEPVQNGQGGNYGLLLSSTTVTFTGQPSLLVADQVTLNWVSRNSVSFQSVTLTETATDSNRYEAPSTHPGLALVLDDEGQFNPVSIDTIGAVTIYHPVESPLGERFRLLEEDAVASLSFDGDLFEAYELDAGADGYLGDSFQMGQLQAVYDSDGGTTNAHVIEIRGPEPLLSAVTSLTGFGAVSGTILHFGQKIEDGRRFVVAQAELARAATSFLAREAQALRDLSNEFINADSEQKKLMLQQTLGYEKAFDLGATHGFLAGGWEMVSGTVVFVYDIGKYAFIDEAKDMLVLFEGGREMIRWKEEVDTQMAEVATFVKDIILPLVWKTQRNQLDMELALLLGDAEAFGEAYALSENERIMFEYIAELLPGLLESWNNLPAYDQGYYTGIATFEAVTLIVAWAKAGKIGQAGKISKLGSKGEFLTELKAVRFFNSGPGKQAIDTLFELGGFMERLATTSICFPGETPVLTIDGLRSIATIKPGDRVWSRDPNKGEHGWKPVVEVFVTNPDQFYRLQFRRLGSGSDEEPSEIRTTSEHPIWVAEPSGFVPAEDLVEGDRFMLYDGGKAVLLQKRLEISPARSNLTAFNFEVQDWHTYFVGEIPIWVHNKGRTCDKLFSVWERLFMNSGSVAESHRRLIRLTPNMTEVARDKLTWGLVRSGGEIDKLKNAGRLSPDFIELGTENNLFNAREAFVADRFKLQKGKNLTGRSNQGADFVETLSDGSHRHWDAKGPFPGEFIDQQIQNILDGFDNHYAIHFAAKDEYLVVDMSGLRPGIKNRIRNHLKSLDPNGVLFEILDDI